MSSASWAWLSMLKDVMESGADSRPRSMPIKEILGYHSVVDMEYPIVSVVERKLSRKFLAGEALWILTGDNRVSTIAPYNPNISKFSDDGKYFAGAYGPRVVDQLSYGVDSLVKDPDTRQAVLTIWRPNPRPSKDIPCTVALQWFVRQRVVMAHREEVADYQVTEIHCVDTMRSSDAWLGWPYDVFNFTILTCLVALMYQERTGIQLALGKLHMQCGSQHVYQENWEAVSRIIHGHPTDPRESIGAVPCVPYAPLNLGSFHSSDQLLEHVRKVRDASLEPSDEVQFMREFLPKEKACEKK